jgi:hypothetical protein
MTISAKRKRHLAKVGKMSRLSLKGMTFGKLTVVNLAGVEPKRKQTMWRCHCECGNTTIVYGRKLTGGNTKSCGCLRHFGGAHLRTHGLSQEPEYKAWKNMRTRCLNFRNKNFADYGGRGITICERWDDFANFFTDMGARPTPQHTLDRIDNMRGYEPSNCHWVTRKAQANNRRPHRKHKPKKLTGRKLSA